jgi:hypothetical protein
MILHPLLKGCELGDQLLKAVDVPLDVVASAILVEMIRARDCEAKVAWIAAHAPAAVTAWDT